VGKSTLVNLLSGGKVAIVGTAPQTTRNAIRGIVNRPEGQLVLVDTPGRHGSERKFNRKLREVADRALEGADLILYLLDAARPPGTEEEAVAARLSPVQDRLIAAINKTDAPGADPGSLREFLQDRLPELPEERIFAVSALWNEGIAALEGALFALAPEGPPFSGEDCYTDQDVPFRIAEIIREKAVSRLREELPHSLYVEVADAELRDGEKLWVRAFIVTERESQKGMVVGKGGTMIKAIREAALRDLRDIFDWRIELDLRVKASRDWRHNDALLRRLIDRN
jgi:GTP-binding protein Era